MLSTSLSQFQIFAVLFGRDGVVAWSHLNHSGKIFLLKPLGQDSKCEERVVISQSKADLKYEHTLVCLGNLIYPSPGVC